MTTTTAATQWPGWSETLVTVPCYTLILGDFYIRYPDLPRNGPQPDGDTINFLPDNDDLIRSLPRFGGVRPDRRHLGTYGIRFEGIDALETHFGKHHQQLGFARAARDRMLGLIGFGEITFWPDRPNTVQTAQHHPRPGFVLANGVEGNGRVLGLVYPGAPDLSRADGDRVFVDETLLERSVNAALVREGLAYAELYATMPLDLIARMRQLVTVAREDKEGFWEREDLTTTSRLRLLGLDDLDTLVMFPKLYRRLVTYFTAGHTGLAGFDGWLRSDPVHRDDRALLPTGELGNLHDLYHINPDGMTLRLRPECLTFDPIPRP